MAQSQSLVDLSGLQWVRGELDQNLERVHHFIEAYLENPEDKLPLQRSVIELHQARGILAMVRLHGAALLAEELRQAVHDVLHGVTDNVESVFEVTLGGAVQLSDYLDFIQAESVDSALIFHPLINELRVARGKPVVNESELFVRFLLLEPPVVELPDISGRDHEAACRDAKSFQMHFQAALLGVLKDREAQANLLRLGQICQQLLKGLSEPLVYQQWLFAEAVLEALVDRGLDTSLDIKRLLGRMGMLLKYLATEGQASPNAHDREVAYALLYHVGRSSSSGHKVEAVRTLSQLERMLPSPQNLDSIRNKLRGPNTSLLETLSTEIRNDLAVVKDNLDLLLRAGDKAPDRLDETVSTIKRVATTLDMLGMTALQRVVMRQADIINRRRDETNPDQKEWLDAAISLLWVEHSLDELLFRHVHPDARKGAAPPEEPGAGSISPLEVREGAASILREALVNITRLKELTNQLLTAYDAESVGEMDQLLHEMSAGLSVIGLEESEVVTVQKLRSFVHDPAFRFIGNDEVNMGHYADAVSSLELYLLALQAKQDNAPVLLQKCNDYISDLQLPEIPPEAEKVAEPEPATVEPVTVAAAIPDVPVISAEVDPEIREIFLEEVEEIHQNLTTQVPRWSHNIDDVAVLTDIRRAFHTLKGSGRMAGADAIGDFGWAVEQLLNGCLDGTLTADHAVVNVVKSAAEHLGELSAAYADSVALPAAARQIILDAHRLTGTEPPAHVLGASADREEEEDLWTIFSKDAEQHLGNLQAFVESAGIDLKPQLVTAELTRAFHTLKSGARLVGADELSRLAAEMETLTDAIRATGRTMTSDQTALVVRVTEVMGKALAARGNSPDLNELIPQAQLQVKSLPDEASASDRELVVIFTDEACDLLDNIDAVLQDWFEAPDDAHHPLQIIQHCDVLAETAVSAKATPLAMVAQAMRNLVNDWQGADVSPQLIARLSQVLVGIYEMLDRLRHGAKVEQAGDLLSQLQLLSEAEHEVRVPDTGTVEPVTEAYDPRMASDLETAFVAAPEPEKVVEQESAVVTTVIPEAEIPAAVEIPDFAAFSLEESAADQVEPQADAPELSVEPPEAFEYDRQQLPVDEFAASHAKEHMDAELLALFVEEGEEILESIGGEIDRWEHYPDSPGSLIELMRLLHTLKGSARMAGATHIGDLSHGLEDRLTELARSGEIANAEFFVELRSISDAIHAELVGYRYGSTTTQSAEPVSAMEPPPPVTVPPVSVPQAPEPAAVESSMFVPDEEILSMPPDEEPPIPAVVESVPEPEPISIPEPILEPEPAPEVLSAPVNVPEPPVITETPRDDVKTEQEVKADVPEDRPAPPLAVETGRTEAPRMATAETARVSMAQLDRMFNEAGEVGIYLGRMEKQHTDLKFHLKEMSGSIAQIRDRIRLLDIEAEQQMQAGRDHRSAQQKDERYDESFDPLEMDRFTRMNELSRSLNESAADLVSLQTLMEEVNSSNENLLIQQGRITSNLQHGLMNTMLVPFTGLVQRLQRTVRQTAMSNGKQARIEFEGADNELDRNVLERMVGPLEHLLRNAVVHGIEKPDDRQLANKDREGRIRVSLRRDGTQSIIEVSDDGRGLDLASIRRSGIEKHLIAKDAELDDQELVQLIFEPGFSTAATLTHEAGRGVGMDVVNSEIKQLGGSLNVSFVAGQGSQFLIRIPSSLALTNALLVRVGGESFAVSMAGIDGIERLPRAELPRYLTEGGPQVLYGGQSYPAIRFANLINATIHESDEEESKNVPVLLIHTGETRFALVVDEVIGGDELIVKSLGPQVSAIPGVSGGTILADGSVVLIIDVATLYQTRHRRVLAVSAPADQAARVRDERPLILIVDDSITIRRVTERFLSRHGYRTDTAKDGMDALPKLQAERPDAVLLDVEMPRIDGFEVATYMRNNEGLHDVPILMITSRSGEKHRQRAAEIGVDRYIIKPYQEDDLLQNIEAVLRAQKVH